MPHALGAGGRALRRGMRDMMCHLTYGIEVGSYQLPVRPAGRAGSGPGAGYVGFLSHWGRLLVAGFFCLFLLFLSGFGSFLFYFGLGFDGLACLQITSSA